MNQIELVNRNGIVVVSSRKIAEDFGKQHKDVLESIREIQKGAAEKSATLFIPSRYKHEQNKQWYPEYLCTRDGFTLLAMGFTGQKSLEWKLKYIDAFNKMEETIKSGTLAAMPKDYPTALRALANEVEKSEGLQLENAQQKQQIAELKPKADYTDEILRNKGLVTITQIAKDYGMSGQAMNQVLHEAGIQYKCSGQWLLYSKYQSFGYTHSETIAITHNDGRDSVEMHTKWTQKGRLFLYDTLKDRLGILPLIEQPESA